jgi:tetratricopeptide (TPR) repeat protein
MQKTENSQAAVLNATRGVKLAESLGEAETQMQLQITLGDARQQLGESEQAATVYGQALAIARTRGDAQYEAIILSKLGSAQLDSGDAQTAIDTLEQALAMFKTQGKRDYEGRVLGALGSAYGELERWSEAINFHMSALYIAREVKDREEESLQLSSLGYASIQAGQLGQAVLRYRQALHLAYQANNRSNIVSTLVDLVRLLARSPRHLSVSELLINDALKYDPNDKDAKQFKERITSEKTMAAANNVTLVPVNGDALTYASNAYRLLDE